MFVVLCAFSLFVMNFSYEVKTSLLVAYDFGFELINSYTQKGQLETASTNAMFRMSYHNSIIIVLFAFDYFRRILSCSLFYLINQC